MSALSVYSCFAYEKVLEQIVFASVILKTVANSTKKKYKEYKSSFGNLEDAKYMTQTSFLILSKWDNLVNVIGLLFDIDLNNLSVKNVINSMVNTKSDYMVLFTVKKTIKKLQSLGRKMELFLKKIMDSNEIQNQYWMLKVVMFYYLLIFFKTLTWNSVMLSLLLSLAKTSLSQQNLQPIKTISHLLTNMLDFFKYDHLKNFFRLSKPEDQSLTQRSWETLSNEMSDNLALNIKDWENIELSTGQYSYFKDHIIPSTNYFLVDFWSSILSSMIPDWFRETISSAKL
jgi:hypothetical protein